MLSRSAEAQTYADKNYYLVDSLDLDQLEKEDRKLIDSALAVFHKKSHDTTKINAISAIIDDSWDEKVWPKYNQWLLDYITEREFAFKELKVSNAVKKHLLENKAGAINLKGFYLQGKGEYNRALKHFQKSLGIAKNLENEELKAIAYNNIGHVYKTKGKIVEALEYYQRSLKTMLSLDNTEGIATSLNNIGTIYRNVGDIPKALSYYFRSLKILEELDEKRGEAVLRSNIGGMYEQQGDTTSALKFLNQSLLIDRQLNNKRGEAISLNHIGSIYSKRGDTTLALDFFRESLRINEDLGNKEGKASTIFALGEMYLKHGESIRALTYFNESLTIYEEIEVVPDILSVLNRISETEFQLGNITGAKIAGTRSLNSAQNLGFPEKIGAAAKVLVDVYQSEGNWKRALEMHRLHVEMRDSIRNQETEKNALQQKSNYEIGKQEEKIAVLTTLNEMLERDRKLKEMYLWKNTLVGIFMSIVILLLLVLAFFIYRGLQRQRVINELLERQKNEVTVKNAEKQAMLKEIHHRVKNNLQIVSSLLRFQSREVEDPKIVQMFEDAQNRIISMAMIHEKMYSSEDLKNINIQEHFTSLIEDLVEGYSVGNIIGLDVRVDKVDFGIKTLVPLGLVVNEIVNNSLKHAFNEGESGMINLHLRQVEGQKFEMTIGDNGTGFIKQETQRGLGTELIEIFVAQLDGSVEKFDNGGTQYVINFEVAD